MRSANKKTARICGFLSVALLAICGCGGRNSEKSDTSTTTPPPDATNLVATVGGFDIAAIGKGDMQAISQAMSGGANVNGADSEGFTPLMWASLDGQTAIVTLFLDKGANINAKDKYGRTPLMEAAFRQDNPVVPMLLAKTADVTAKDDQGDTALTIALKEDNQSVVAELKKAGAK